MAEGTKLGGVVGSCRETSINQRWAITLWMKANTGKCWVLLLGWDNPRCTERTGNERLQRKVLNYQSPAEGSEDGEGLEEKLCGEHMDCSVLEGTEGRPHQLPLIFIPFLIPTVKSDQKTNPEEQNILRK